MRESKRQQAENDADPPIACFLCRSLRPNINIFRDPRWGRGQETPGEDPYLTSEYVYALISGLQGGSDPRYLKIVADCKHYNAYDLEDWHGVDRFHFDAQVTDQDLIESYLPAFESCVKDARGASIMCSYNAVNGVPSCANTFAIETILREQYGFDGFVVSDCGAIQAILSSHNYTTSNEETVAAALHAGTDLNCGSFYQDHAQAALDAGTIVEADLDTALTRSLSILLRTGWFDPAASQPYRQLGPADVNTPTSQALALRAAVEGIVLLQNSGVCPPASNVNLPFSAASIKNLAVVGPLYNASEVMLGNYFGQPASIIDPLTAFQSMGFNVIGVKGCDVNSTDASGIQAAVDAAAEADAVVYIGGLTQNEESEGNDRDEINLPGLQTELIQSLASSFGCAKPFVVVIMGGGQVDLSSVRQLVNSILWIGYAGQAGGAALASIIFGETAPAGRLPVTQYPTAYTEQVSMFDMSFRPSATNPGRGYRFYPETEAVFPFGTGLSYTNWQYQWSMSLSETGEGEDGLESDDPRIVELSIDSLLSLHRANRKQPALNYRVIVTNVGSISSDLVVLLFLLPQQLQLSAPFKQLIGFERVFAIAPGASSEVFFGLQVRQLAMVDQAGQWILRPGLYQLGVDVPTRRLYSIRLTGLTRTLD